MSEFIPADILRYREDPEEMTKALFGLGVFKELGISKDWKTVRAGVKIAGTIDLFELKRFFEIYLGHHYKYTKIIVHPEWIDIELEAED